MINDNSPSASPTMSRVRIGRAVHALGMAVAASLLIYAVWLAILWQDTYGALALVSGSCYAIVAYLVGRSVRRVIDPNCRNREA